MPLCLVVDDEEDHREIAGLVAKSAGMEVAMSASAQEALLSCEAKMPDVILLDWMMPDMDGVEFLYQLRQMKNGDKVYVIMCSARNSENAINMAYSMGANAYFTKPFNPEEVIDKLREVYKSKV